jgi:hypothetical protein
VTSLDLTGDVPITGSLPARITAKAAFLDHATILLRFEGRQILWTYRKSENMPYVSGAY